MPEEIKEIILLIEDDAGIAELVREKLGESGKNVAHAKSGKEARIWLEQNHPHLILLDYSLPDMTGAEFVEQTLDIPPFIVATGAGDEKIAVAMMKRGARDYLVKDIHFLDNLPLIVEQVLKEIAIERQLAELEKALEESVEQRRVLIQTAMDGFWMADIQGRLVEVNETYCRMSGYNKSELMTMHISDLESSETADNTIAHIQKVIAQGEDRFETRHRRKDGSMFDVEVSVQYLVVEDGQIVAFLRDITERKQAEAALRESELKYRSLIESSSDAIFCVDEKGQYQFTNQLFASTFGQTPDYFIGKTFWDIYPKEHADYRFEATTRVFQTGKSESLEVEVPLPDRSLFFYATANPIKDETGKVILVLTHAVNITERKQAEDALRESEERYRLLVELSPETVIVHSEGKLDFVNHAGVKMFGGSQPDEMIGKPIKDFIHPSSMSKVIERVRLVQEENKPAPLEELVFCKLDGQAFDVETAGVPITLRGKRASLTLIRDITERKQAADELLITQKALEAANSKLQIALTREKEMARTDVGTGINNRRWLFELAEHEFDVATRYQKPLSVILFDIDHFKQVNDTFGHTLGDQMLKRVAQAACAELRSVDVIGRYGGEEFVIVLPMTNAQDAHSLAERIRKSVAAIRQPTEKGEAAVTLSIGIVEVHHGAQTGSIEDLIRRADEAMYAAKQAGRNRAEIGE